MYIVKLQHLLIKSLHTFHPLDVNHKHLKCTIHVIEVNAIIVSRSTMKSSLRSLISSLIVGCFLYQHRLIFIFDGWSIKLIGSQYSIQRLPNYLCILLALPTNQALIGANVLVYHFFLDNSSSRCVKMRKIGSIGDDHWSQ